MRIKDRIIRYTRHSNSIFADRPITYLYNTLHFYERKLRDRPPLKKLLVKSIISSLASIRPANWAISEQYETYIATADTESTAWQPELTYYISLMRRLVDSKLEIITQTCLYMKFLIIFFHFHSNQWQEAVFPDRLAFQ